MRVRHQGIEKRVEKYLASTERVLREIKFLDRNSVSDTGVQRVVNFARDYFNDSKHYMENRDYVTALSSITYSEGLLDALKLLELAEFTS